MVAAWPWPTTPLLIRIFAAWFSTFSIGLLWFLIDGDWERLALLPCLLLGAAGLDLAALLLHWFQRPGRAQIGPLYAEAPNFAYMVLAELAVATTQASPAHTRLRRSGSPASRFGSGNCLL